MVSRRTFIAGCAATLGTSLLDVPLPAQLVPNSSGTESPMLKAPSDACDCHHHIYDAKFPPVRQGAGFQPNGRVEDYRLLQKRLGTTRDVVVTPLPYAGDNRVTLDAVQRLAPNARGVVLLRPDVTDAELRRLTDGGIRGLRFSMGNAGFGMSNPVADIEPLTKRIAEFGWHTQIYMRGDQIVQMQNVLSRIPTGDCVRSLGRIGPPRRQASGIYGHTPACWRRPRLGEIVRGAWVKLSGAYITPTGFTTNYRRGESAALSGGNNATFAMSAPVFNARFVSIAQPGIVSKRGDKNSSRGRE